MTLKTGLYEQLINMLLDSAVKKLSDGYYEIQKEKIDEAEAHVVLSKYLQIVIQQSLRSLPVERRLEKQIETCNQIISFIKNFTNDESLTDTVIPADTEILLAILDSTSIPPGTRNHIPRILANELEEFTSRPSTRLRIITTTYIGATDIQCLDFLRGLPNTEIKVSLDATRTRLHAKAYLFCRDTGFTTAYIGSSNISNPALTSGLEWNLKITAADAKDIINKFEGTFETYWNDNEFLTYTPEIRERVVNALKLGKEPSVSITNFLFDIRPYSYQQEILDKNSPNQIMI